MRDRGTILWLDPRTLIEDPQNVRHEAPDLDGLAASIQEYGVLQPLGVTRHAERYHVVYGTRRRRAAVMANLDTVPCVELSGDRLVCQLLENLQRVELNDMEKSDGFARLKEQLALDNSDLSETRLDELTGKKLGLSSSTVRRYLRLRELPAGVRARLRSGDLNVTQAQHLFALSDASKQEEMSRIAAERGLSAAVVSRACGLLVTRPTLGVEDAVAAAERGEAATTSALSNASADAAKAQAPRLAPRPKAEESIDEDRELWGDEAVTDDDMERAAREERRPSAVDNAFADVATADGHRVFRIRTVDAFCDEVARIARCVSDGDLARSAATDRKAAVKLDLAKRQIQYILGALEGLVAEAVPA